MRVVGVLDVPGRGQSPYLAAALGVLLVLGSGWESARAQDTLPPAQGGYVHSLGLPEIYKPYIGFGIGLSRLPDDHLTSHVHLGVFRDFGNPVTELWGWSVEGYVGMRDVHADGGVRALLQSNLLRVGAGLDYNVPDGAGDLLLTFVAPTRRGGIIGRGSDLRFEWLPTRGGSFNLVVTLPLHQPHRGATRPQQDHVVLHDVSPRPVPYVATEPALVEALERVREAATWINRFTLPPLGPPGGDSAGVAGALAPLKERLAGRTVEVEIRVYHAELARAFAIAVSGQTFAPGERTPLGDSVAQRAKAILLEDVLFPYNRLLGQKKEHDTTREFGGHARGMFARWLVTESPLPVERAEAALYVFQCLLDVVEDVRAANRKSWGTLAWSGCRCSSRSRRSSTTNSRSSTR